VPSTPISVTSGRAQLAVERSGDGRPVVFLHAGVADRRSWRAVIGELDGVRAVAYDRRGFGDTTYEAEEHSPLDDLLVVLDAEGIERVVLVGNSMGGGLAVDAALAHPDRVEALLLLAPSISGASHEEPEVGASLEAAIERAEAAGDLDAVNRLEAHLWLDGPAGPEGRVAGAARDLFLDMNGRALRAADPGRARRPPPAWDRLGDLRLPVLVLLGELDAELSGAQVERIADRVPGAEARTMPGVAHLPQLERPEVVATALRELLGRH